MRERTTRGVLCLLVAVAIALAAMLTGADRDARAGDAKEPCVLCAGSLVVPCPTCEAKTKSTARCDACEGTGRRGCPDRVDAPDARTAQILSRVYHAVPERDCPNRFCRSGKVVWEDYRENQCRLCGGSGKYRCAECQTATQPCAACGGKGRIAAPCEECGGRGKLPCLACATEGKRCRGCEGRGKTNCGFCSGSGSAIQACEKCDAVGTVVCEGCFGRTRFACLACSGTGRSRSAYTDGSSASSKKCAECDGKGTATCGCTNGRRKCPECDGAKYVATECRACRGKTTVECRICGPWAFRAREMEAGKLAQPGASPAATEAAARLYRAAVVLADRSTQAAGVWAGSLGAPKANLPELHDGESDPSALQQYVKRLYEERGRLSELAEANARVAEFKAAAERARKALDKLGGPAPVPAPEPPIEPIPPPDPVPPPK